MPATAPSRRRGFSLRGRLFAFTALLAAGCVGPDADHVRICRITLPALEPAGARIEPGLVAASHAGVRIDYRATLAGDAVPRERFAECRFAAGRRADLTAITTDRGEVPGATVFLLKRYYVETPDGAAGDPGPRDRHAP